MFRFDWNYNKDNKTTTNGINYMVYSTVSHQYVEWDLHCKCDSLCSVVVCEDFYLASV